MKDDLPPGWATASVGEIIEARNGRAFKSSEWTKEGTPIIRIQNLKDAKAGFNHFKGSLEQKHTVKSGDLLFAWSGTPGTSFGAHIWKGGYAALNQHIFRLDFNRVAFNADYLCYALNQNVTRYIEQAQGGVGLAHITKTKFDASLIRVPPTNEQDRIVDRLDELFSRIDEGERALERVQKLVERYRQSVLKAAVTGELTREWREKNKEKLESGEALLARILKDRREAWEKVELKRMKANGITPANDQWKQKYKEPSPPDTSDLPRLPAGWAWASLPQLGEFGRGKSKHRPRNDPKLYGGRYPFLQTGRVRASGGRITEFDTTYSDVGLAQSKLWPPGTICITIAANIAESGILEFAACFPDSVVGLVPCDLVVPEYVEFFVRTERTSLDRYAPATAQKNINLEILEQVAVPLPPLEEQRAIYSKAQEELSKIADVKRTFDRAMVQAGALRQTTLRSAFKGDLVPQHPADEPASALLQRIAANRPADALVPKRGRKRKTAE
jgi:type I restriction enzyme, S subunit